MGIVATPDTLADDGEEQESEAEPTPGEAEAPRSMMASLAETTASAEPVPGLTVRAATLAVLTVWDDPTEGRPGLAGAMAALRAALAPRADARIPKPAGVPRQPRPDTQRAAVLTLLRRPEGATVAKVIAVLGLPGCNYEGDNGKRAKLVTSCSLESDTS